MTFESRGRIFIYGASGHAKVVIDAVEKQGLYEISFLVDDNDKFHGKFFFGYPVLGRTGLVSGGNDQVEAGIVAIGDNQIRLRIAGWIKEAGFGLAHAVHPSAQLARGVTIGEGTVIMAGGIVNADTVIGSNVIINTAASVDHDCLVEEGAHIAPGCRLCGGVRVGRASLVGAGSVVIPGVSVGGGVVVGAGATVIRDVVDGKMVVGGPARELRSDAL